MASQQNEKSTQLCKVHVTYVTEQILLPHYTYVSWCHHIVWAYIPDIGANVPQHNQLQHLIHIILVYMCHKQIQPLNCTYMPYIKYLTCICGGHISMHVPHAMSLASNLWPGTLCTNNDYNNDDANINHNFWLHMLSWLMGQVSQKLCCNLGIIGSLDDL